MLEGGGANNKIPRGVESLFCQKVRTMVCLAVDVLDLSFLNLLEEWPIINNNSTVRMGRVKLNIFIGKEVYNCDGIHFDNDFFDVLICCKHEAILKAPQCYCRRVSVPEFFRATTNLRATCICNNTTCASTIWVSSGWTIHVQLKETYGFSCQCDTWF